jgi:type VI secretion system protein ImpG
MFKRYLQEMSNLRDLGEEFSKAHPDKAGMLSERRPDPDVERLLEGTAFLTALLREKLEDEFPEIIHELVKIIWPHYLRPIPSASILAFMPKPTLKQTIRIDPGTQVASKEVEGTQCLFNTCFPVEMHPLSLLEASLVESSGQLPAIKLLLELKGPSLSDWQPKSLRFYIGGENTTSTELYRLLRNDLKEIHITSSDNNRSLILTPNYLKPVGFASDESLIPYPMHILPGYRIIQEYFILPEKFLFFDLKGWERWEDRGGGNRFEINFIFKKFPRSIPRVKSENFVLFATPVINVFPFDADPIRLDHRKTEYRVSPSSNKSTHYQVYSVEKVVGFVQGTARERVYVPFELFNPDIRNHPVYHTHVRNSPDEHGFDVYLSVAYSKDSGLAVTETLSIQLQCTNGVLSEGIRTGDICLPTSSSPEYTEFKNLRPPTSTLLPPLGTNLLWRFLSHLSLNYVSLANVKNLQAMLDLYNFEETRDRRSFLANQRRIAGIKNLSTRTVDRLVAGVVMRGREIQMDIRKDHFIGSGDLYLFGCILDFFLGSYASINTFTQLIVKEVVQGDIYKWETRIGDQPLI